MNFPPSKLILRESVNIGAFDASKTITLLLLYWKPWFPSLFFTLQFFVFSIGNTHIER